MKIVWFNWKDIHHPDAGGAEIVTHELLRRLAADGHQVTLVTARYPGSKERDHLDGFAVWRSGNRFTHYAHAVWLFLTELRGDTELIVEEVNTVPYLLTFFPSHARVLLFYPQLAREIWFYQMQMPWSLIGYVSELLYTWLQGRPRNDVVTISEDSRNDLVRFGFRREKIHLMTLGIDNHPLDILDSASKEARFTVLFHSSLRAMKRPDEMLRAFRLMVDAHHDGQLWISGGGDQHALREFCRRHALEDRVTFFGRTSDVQKLDLMRRATVLCSTSLKEGWGLVVTEANSMGTPAVVYDVDGLRSASRAGGNWTVRAAPAALAERLIDLRTLFMEDRSAYDAWCERVHATTRHFTYDQSYRDFQTVIQSGQPSEETHVR